MTILKRGAALLLFLVAACAAAAPTPEPGWRPVGVEDVHARWWAEQRWRYPSDAAAEGGYQALVVRQSAWPEWHQKDVVALPAGLRFQMALSPGQPVDRPGAFGTFDRIPDVAWVRRVLAVKVAWKPEIDRVVTYEVATPLAADVGTVGPQIDEGAHRYLPGGGSQLEMQVPAAERFAHLKVIEVRDIK
ncbi:MAG: hypothetical protein QOH04_2333 [Sphingomonadales bacterium]|jgi:hypothetical protein|nr:hypothetical protein [Sphingomonadales bacterium]